MIEEGLGSLLEKLFDDEVDKGEVFILRRIFPITPDRIYCCPYAYGAY